jgi:hypothetical protein
MEDVGCTRNVDWPTYPLSLNLNNFVAVHDRCCHLVLLYHHHECQCMSSSSSLHRLYAFKTFVPHKVTMIFCPTCFVIICLVGHHLSISTSHPCSQSSSCLPMNVINVLSIGLKFPQMMFFTNEF